MTLGRPTDKQRLVYRDKSALNPLKELIAERTRLQALINEEFMKVYGTVAAKDLAEAMQTAPSNIHSRWRRIRLAQLEAKELENNGRNSEF